MTHKGTHKCIGYTEKKQNRRLHICMSKTHKNTFCQWVVEPGLCFLGGIHYAESISANSGRALRSRRMNCLMRADASCIEDVAQTHHRIFQPLTSERARQAVPTFHKSHTAKATGCHQRSSCWTMPPRELGSTKNGEVNRPAEKPS